VEVDEALVKVEELIRLGEKFTYANFSAKSRHGYPSHYLPDWVAWRARVNGAITSMFEATSAPVQMVQAGSRLQVIGNGADKFELAKSHYMGALRAAEAVLKDDTFGEIRGSSAKGPLNTSNRVFIVHGHDEAAKGELEAILTEMGLEPVVLHRQADGGRTVIEKFEAYADVGFAFILLTPDEVAYLVADEAKDDLERNNEYRARPNVIFEFGYFVGRLGRARTCCLYKTPVTLPSDVNGIIYKRFERSIEEVAYAVGKELRSAGYKLK
jgi:predicted nucleotide-binding protein